MKAIVNVDKNWGIGLKGNLLEKIPEDLKFFKEKTLGKVVVMGRETLESLPGKKPLKDRVNIVLSSKGQFEDNEIIVCRSLDELFDEIKKYNTNDVFAIGGESIYRQLLPYCNEVFITKNNKIHKADKFYPNLDEDSEWKIQDKSEEKEYNGISFCFIRYVRK